jgi:hypothetical protein
VTGKYQPFLTFAGLVAERAFTGGDALELYMTLIADPLFGLGVPTVLAHTIAGPHIECARKVIQMLTRNHPATTIEFRTQHAPVFGRAKRTACQRNRHKTQCGT